MKQLPRLDFQTRSPKFNDKCPKGKTNKEILAEVERKVTQMIRNYTHKEWECAQKILKDQGHVNRVLEEMKFPCPLQPKPAAPGKKMQPADNVGSEPVEISKKDKTSKMSVMTEGTSKVAKDTKVLVHRKAEVAKTTLPPIVEKSSKLMKVSESLIHQKTDVAKVVAAEKEKKKAHDVALAINLEKKTFSKRKAPSTSEKDKGVVIKEEQPEATKPREKKPRMDLTAEKDENTDVLATLQIQLLGNYPPKAKEPQEPKDQPVIVPIDLAEAVEIEDRTERAQVYFSATCPPGERMKQTPEVEAAGKRYWEHQEGIGEFLIRNPTPENPVTGLMDVIDDTEELYYIDNGTPMETSEKNPSVSMFDEARVNLSEDKGQGAGLKAGDPIELCELEIEKPEENPS